MNKLSIALSTYIFLSLTVVADDCPGLAITNQPTTVAACPDEMAVFTISATGSGPLTYQWRKDCFPLQGEDMDTLVIDPISESDYGHYTCVVSDSCGTLTSATARLWPGDQPIYISSAPQSQSVCEGGTAVLSVNASGFDLAYQWRHDCVPIPGATSSTLTLEDFGSADQGHYSCAVSNTCASITTSAAELKVGIPDITIAVQPTNKTVCDGTSVTYSVAVNGLLPASYQWYKDDVELVGETQADLTFTATAADSGANFRCQISRDCAVVYSRYALLTVRTPPTITVQPVSVVTCENATAVFSVTATGTGPLTYKWYKDGNLISGQTQSTLSRTASSSNLATYTCKVTNACTTVTSEGATLSLRAPLELPGEPENVVACPGSDVTYTVVATGGEPISYAWTKDGVPIDGETSATLTLHQVSASDEATYRCTISNPCEFIYSPFVTLQLAVVCEASTPDPELRNFLLTGTWDDRMGNHFPIDPDGNGITLAEAQAVTGHLDLSRLQLTDLTGIGVFSNMTDLDASRNRLTELPAEFSNLTLLERLDLSYNRLTAMPDLSAQTMLTQLDLSHNRIGSGGSRGGGSLPSSLNELDLTDNDLTALPDLSGLDNLHRLLASYNRIEQIDNLLAQTPVGSTAGDLIELDHNQLTMDDCAQIQSLEARTSGAGATFQHATQLDFSQLSAWPSTTILELLPTLETTVGCTGP